MGVVARLRRALVDQPQIRLVDERRRLQGVIRTFCPQVAPRNPTQLLVHEGQEAMQRFFVSGAPQPKELTWRWGLG